MIRPAGVFFEKQNCCGSIFYDTNANAVVCTTHRHTHEHTPHERRMERWSTMRAAAVCSPKGVVVIPQALTLVVPSHRRWEGQVVAQPTPAVCDGTDWYTASSSDPLDVNFCCTAYHMMPCMYSRYYGTDYLYNSSLPSVSAGISCVQKNNAVCRWCNPGFLSHTRYENRSICSYEATDRFLDLPTRFPTCFPTASRHIYWPFPSQREVMDSFSIPPTYCLATFPSHFHPAIRKRERFPVLSLGKTQNMFRLRRATRYCSTVPLGAARSPGKPPPQPSQPSQPYRGQHGVVLCPRLSNTQARAYITVPFESPGRRPCFHNPSPPTPGTDTTRRAPLKNTIW